MEARKRELVHVYRACVSDRFPWNTTRATPQAPESTEIAHLAASFRRARHGSATPNAPLRAEKRTSAIATTARKRHRRFGRKRGKNAGFAVGWSRAALVGPSPTLACSHDVSLACRSIDPDFDLIAGHKSVFRIKIATIAATTTLCKGTELFFCPF